MAFDPRLRPYDVIHDMHGLENQGVLDGLEDEGVASKDGRQQGRLSGCRTRSGRSSRCIDHSG